VHNEAFHYSAPGTHHFTFRRSLSANPFQMYIAVPEISKGSKDRTGMKDFSDLKSNLVGNDDDQILHPNDVESIIEALSVSVYSGDVCSSPGKTTGGIEDFSKAIRGGSDLKNVPFKIDSSRPLNLDNFWEVFINEEPMSFTKIDVDVHSETFETDSVQSKASDLTLPPSISGKEVSQVRKHSDLSIKDLEIHYSKPLTEAAKALSLSPTMLKKICRNFGIRRWPHRQIASVERTQEQLRKRLIYPDPNSVVYSTQHERNTQNSLKNRILELETRKKDICKATSNGFNPSDVKKKRSRKNKKHFAQTNSSAVFDSSMNNLASSLPKALPAPFKESSQCGFQNQAQFCLKGNLGKKFMSPAQQLIESCSRAVELQQRSHFQKNVESILPQFIYKDGSPNENYKQLNKKLKTLETSPVKQLLHLQRHIKSVLEKKSNSSVSENPNTISEGGGLLYFEKSEDTEKSKDFSLGKCFISDSTRNDLELLNKDHSSLGTEWNNRLDIDSMQVDSFGRGFTPMV